MARLIPNDETLRLFVPQQVVHVKGETALFDKIARWLDTAEQWLSDNITSAPTLNRIAEYSDGHPLLRACRAAVAHRALADAIPSLDLVQTVNGFAVVSNQNLAPASRDRVDRLIAAHRSQCDSAISALIPLLADAHAWRGSPQCEFFRATLFQPKHIISLSPLRLSACRLHSKNPQSSQWDKYRELHPAIVNAEAALAARYISHGLMHRLRDAALGLNPISTLEARLCEALRGYVADIVCDRPLRDEALRDIVEYIRNRPDTFPEWHRSETARLFSPPVFRNRKDAKGYWF